jgi:hypothetical protein
MNPNNYPNFIECLTVEEANQIDLEKYTFIRYSDNRNVYIFKIRQQ